MMQHSIKPSESKDGQRIYTVEDKVCAALQYLVLGNMDRAAAALEIPKTTLQKWMEHESWADCVAIAMQMQRANLEARLTVVIDKCIEQVLDRVDNGDTIMGKDGPVKVPVKAKDLAWIAAVNIDKRSISRGLPTSISGRAGQRAAAVARRLSSPAVQAAVRRSIEAGATTDPENVH